MNVGDLVRIMDGERAGMTGTVLHLSHLYAQLRLTSTGEIDTFPRADLLYVDPEPLSVAEWKALHGTWKRRNARVIARLQAWRESRGIEVAA
jgi:hypothetical protein